MKQERTDEIFMRMVHPVTNDAMWVFPSDSPIASVQVFIEDFIQEETEKNIEYGLQVQDVRTGCISRIDCDILDIGRICEDIFQTMSEKILHYIRVNHRSHSIVVGMVLLDGRLSARALYVRRQKEE